VERGSASQEVGCEAIVDARRKLRYACTRPFESFGSVPSLSRQSPYLRNPARLADLIAAIQVLGTYKFSTRPVSRWEKRLGRKPVSAESWLALFGEHPEFFTQQDPDLVSLVWRRSKERNYDTFEDKLLPRDIAARMAEQDPESQAARLSRPPLDTGEISKLIDIAVSLHEREIKHRQERRWWYAAVIAAAGVLVSLGARLHA
jgi:hypothetical protein